MTSISKKVYIHKLDDTINKYNNTYSTIKLKHVDLNSSTYIHFNVKKTDKNTKFNVRNHVRTSKYKIILPKGYTPN